MITILPTKWCIIATNDEQSETLKNYINTVLLLANQNEDITAWDNSDALRYYLAVDNGVYVDGLNEESDLINTEYRLITFMDFQKYVLGIEIKQEKITLNVKILNKLLK